MRPLPCHADPTPTGPAAVVAPHGPTPSARPLRPPSPAPLLPILSYTFRAVTHPHLPLRCRSCPRRAPPGTPSLPTPRPALTCRCRRVVAAHVVRQVHAPPAAQRPAVPPARQHRRGHQPQRQGDVPGGNRGRDEARFSGTGRSRVPRSRASGAGRLCHIPPHTPYATAPGGRTWGQGGTGRVRG